MPLAQMHGRTHLSLGSDPIPGIGASFTEWYQGFANNQSLGTSLTQIVWTGGNSGGEYDTTVPTFAVNGSGNLELGKDGTYVMEIFTGGWALAANVDSVLILEVQSLAAPHPTMGFGSLGSGFAAQNLLRANITGGTSNYTTLQIPEVSFHMALTTGSTSGGLTSEIRVRAYVTENNSGVAHAEPEFYFMLQRFGSAFV